MSGVDVKYDRLSVVAVARGLMVVRYVSSGSDKDFPSALVRPAPQSERALEIISAPGSPQGRLDRPGDCVVVRAHDAGQLEVALRRTAPDGSIEATIQIDSISGGKAAAPVPSNPRAVAQPIPSSVVGDFRDVASVQGQGVETGGSDIDVGGIARRGVSTAERPTISILGHVAMRGDLELGEDQWIAGPTAPAPIEGMNIRSADASALSVDVQVLVAGAQQWSNWMSSGGYAGTRGRGLPLLGVRLRLGGSAAGQWQLAAEALFLGSTSIVKSGRQVEFVSATGSDPLVGLKLSVRTIEKSPIAQSSDGPWRDRGARVRVFRSSSGS